MTDNNKNESILNQEKDEKIKIQEDIGSSKKL